MIQAVIFDIDGVLVDSFEANLKFFEALFTKAGYTPPTREEYRTLFAKSLKEVIEIVTKSKSEEEVQRIWDMGASRAVPYDLSLISTPEHAEEVIKKLHETYMLALVTSRIRDYVFESPQLEKLKEYFRAVVSYEDTDKHKPDPEPLLLAMKKIGVVSENSVYIGDSPGDVVAAKAAGMKSISYPKLLEGADGYVSTFPEIPNLLNTF